MTPMRTSPSSASPFLQLSEGWVGVAVIGLILASLPLGGLDAPGWAIGAVYVAGVAAMAGHFLGVDHVVRATPVAVTLPVAWVSAVVLVTGGAGSPYVYAYGMVVLMLATFRKRREYLLGAMLSVMAGSGIRALADNGGALPMTQVVAGALVVLVAAWVMNAAIESLRVSHAQNQSLVAAIDGLEQPVSIYDPAGDQCVYINRAGARNLGLEPEDVIGQPATIGGRARDEAVSQGVSIAAALASGGVLRQEVSLPMPDGDVRDFEIAIQAVATGDVSLIVSVANDVTALQRALRAQREAAERLSGLDDLKNAFVSAASHELRTPLTIVKGLAETIANNPERLARERLVELASRIERHAGRLADVIEDLFDVDRLTHGQLEPSRDLVDPAAIVRAALEHRHASSLVALKADATAAKVDPMMLERIVDNLITNALKYADAPIEVALDPLPGYGLNLIVSDRGPGVPDESKATVFEPFIRLDPKHPSPGTGVGLSLVANFAGLHGGRVWIEDREGGGTRVHVLLPGPDAAQPASGPASVGDRRQSPRVRLDA